MAVDSPQKDVCSWMNPTIGNSDPLMSIISYLPSFLADSDALIVAGTGPRIGNSLHFNPSSLT